MNRKSMLLPALLIYSFTGYAQTVPGTSAGRLKIPGLNLPMEISPKGGMVIPSTGVKQTSFLGQGWMGGLDISLPVFSSKSQSDFTFNIGAEASADYSALTANGGMDYVQSTYQLSNGSMNPYFDNSANKASVLQFSIGPKISLGYKRIHLTPGIQLGYISFQRNGYSILDTLRSSAGNKATIPLLLAKENKTNGLLLRPKINIAFDVNRYIRASIGSSYTMGPNIVNEYQIWEPAKKSQNRAYTADELTNGKSVQQNVGQSFKAFNIELGITMALGITPLSKPNIKFPQKISVPSIYGGTVAPDKLLKTRGGSNGVTNKSATATTNNFASAAKTYPATAPQIVYPANNGKTALINNNLHFTIRGSNTDNVKYVLTVWTEKNGKKKEILNQTYPNNWDGVVRNFADQVDKKNLGSVIFHAQLRAVPGNSDVQGNKGSGDYHNTQQSGIPVFPESIPVAFSLAAGCFPELAVDLDSAKCVDSNKSKVWGHIMLNNTTGLTVTNITITDFRENNFSGPAVPVSNLAPGTSLPPVNNTQFSFKVDKDMCGKILFMRVLITYTCVLTGESVTVPCADTISMPCCKCNYCVDSMKITSQNSGITYNNINNSAQISQTFSVLPNNITYVTAEIVYMSDSANDPACMACDSRPASVYHFLGTNTMSWNGSTAVNASAANASQSFPSKIISWQCNNNGSVSFNLNTGLPEMPKLDCCERNTRICIRYSFTDVNCKKCDILVCYSLSYTGQTGTTDTH